MCTNFFTSYDIIFINRKYTIRDTASYKKLGTTKRKTSISAGSYFTTFRRRKLKNRYRARTRDIKAAFFLLHLKSRLVHTRGSSQWVSDVEWSTVYQGWRNCGSLDRWSSVLWELTRATETQWMVYLPTIPLSEVGTIVRRKYLPDSIKCRMNGSINVPVLYDLAHEVITVIMKIMEISQISPMCCQRNATHSKNKYSNNILCLELRKIKELMYSQLQLLLLATPINHMRTFLNYFIYNEMQIFKFCVSGIYLPNNGIRNCHLHTLRANKKTIFELYVDYALY